MIEDDKVDKGIGAFIIDADTKGLKIGPPENKMGWKGSDTRSVYFEDMRFETSTTRKSFKRF